MHNSFGHFLLAPLIFVMLTSELWAAPVEVVLQSEPAGRTAAVALSPDGRVFATVGNGSEVRLWDTKTFRIIRYFTGHQGYVHSVAFSPDGKSLITAASDEDRPVRIWDVESGTQLKSHFDSAGYAAGAHIAEFDKDPKRYVTQFGSRAAVMSVENGTIIRDMAVGTGDNTIISLAANGRFLAAADDGEGLTLWDTVSGKQRGIIASSEVNIRAVAISPDASQIVTGDRDGKLVAWSTTRAGENRTLGKFQGSIDALAYSNDGKFVVVGTRDGYLTVYDALSTRIIKQKAFAGASVNSVSLSNDGKSVLAAFNRADKAGTYDPSIQSSFIVWNLSDGSETRHGRGVPRAITSLGFSDVDGTLVSGDENGNLRRWNVATGELKASIAKFPGGVSGLSLARAGRLMAVSNKSGSQLFSGNAKLEAKFPAGRIQSVVLSPDGRLALANEPTPLTIWDVASGRSIMRPGDGKGVAFSPDGKLFISSQYGVLKVHDTKTGNGVAEDVANYTAIAFSPDSKKLLVGASFPDGGPVRLLEMPSAKELQKFDGDRGRTDSVAYAPDGKTFASGGTEMIVKIYYAWNGGGSLYRQLIGHAGSVKALAYSKDSKKIFSGSEDGTIKVWDIASGGLLATLIPSPDGDTITLTPEGFFDAKPEVARSLTVVQGLDVFTIDQFYQQLYRPDLVRQKLAGDPDGTVAEAAESLGLDKLVGSGPPPTVSFVGKPGVQDGAVNLPVKLVDNGGGYGKVEWRVNGTTVGVVKVAGGSPTITLSKTIYLSAGANQVEVVAYNGANLVSSEPASLRYDVAITDTTPGRLFVIAVGVSQYFDSRLSLRYAVSDADALGKALTAGSRKLYSSVETVLVADRDATTEGINEAFQKVAAKARPQDTFVFFMAGHGVTDGGKYFFLPYDFVYRDETSIETTAIGQEQLQMWLAMIPTQRSLVLLDTCESGAMTGQELASRGIEQAVAYEKITRAMGRTTIAASSSAAPALEGYKGQGVFTYALLTALASSDTNADGAVDVLEMIGWVDREVPVISEQAFKFRQIPQTSFSGSNFLVSAKLEKSAVGAAASTGVSPAYVLIRSEPYYKKPSDQEAAGELPTGTQVEIMSERDGKALISRKGGIIGYVERSSLAALQ